MEQALQPTRSFSQRLVAIARGFLRGGMWLLLLCWLFSYFGKYFYAAELLSNFRLQFLVLLGVAALLLYFARARGLLLIGVLVALAWSCQETLSVWLPAKQGPPGETVLRLMSFNILATNVAYQPVIDEVKRHDPDVLVVIEYAGNWHRSLDPLRKSYPFVHREPRWHGYGIAIFSKRPLETAKSVPLTEAAIDNPAINVSLRVDDQQLHLTAAHVMSPVNYHRLQLRNEQFKEIAEIVKANSGPSLLVGDMNCTPASGFLKDLLVETGLRDSRRGTGVHCSWIKYAPLLGVPIDHAFVSPQIHVHDRFLGSPCSSDHRPLIVDFSVTPR